MVFRALQRLFGIDDRDRNGRRGASRLDDGPSDEPGDRPSDVLEDAVDLETAAIELEITDTLDLHTFPPRDVADLVREWLDLAYDAGHRELRIIHGKGKGVQRRIVRSILDRDARVVSYGDPGDASSWGATRVVME